MFTPLRSSFPALVSSNADQPSETVLTLQSTEHSQTVTHDGFTIGSHHQCDLSVNDATVPPLHSVIHIQAGAIWIETTDDELSIIVNDRPYRRMALRHDDRLTIGTTEFKVILRAEAVAAIEHASIGEDLSLLTAEELCDRILSEQAMVADFVNGQKSGWEALLRAIEAASDDSEDDAVIEDLAALSEHDQVALDALLGQIQELNETITERTRELTDHEKEVLESNSLMEDSQHQVAQRIDELLDQLSKNDSSNDLRASA